jgi:nucleotide-binding universal stress UspA family protein
MVATTRINMYKHILVPTDGSLLSEAAAQQATAFAKSINAKVTAITASPTFHAVSLHVEMVTDTPQEYEKDARARGENYLAAIKKAASAAGIPCDTIHVFNDHPYQAIIQASKEKGCDLIFMASHGRKGVVALVLGSETYKVLTHSKIPVLVHRS